MKSVIALPLIATLFVAATQADDGEDFKRVEIAKLTPDLDGADAVMTFTIAKTIWLSGTVAKGQARSFLIKVVASETGPRFSVLVMGDLADAMERFGYSPPQQGDPAAGLRVEARGMIKLYPAPEDAPKKGPSYSFQITDLKGFRILSPLIHKRGNS